MSLSNTSVGTTYTGNGVTTSFAIPFQYQLAAEVKVYLILISTGVETALVNPTDFSISGSNIVTVATYANTYHIRVERSTALTQLLDLINNSAFLAEDLEETLDKIVQTLQEQGSQLANSVKLARINYGDTGALPLLVADSLISVNATGDGFIMGPTLTAFNADVAAAAASAAAALVSENNAAASEAAALTAETNAETAETNAETAETNAEAAQTAAEAAQALAEAAQAAAEVAQAAAEAAAVAAAAVPAVIGDDSTPFDVVDTTLQLGDADAYFNIIYVKGDSSPITITTDPAIAAATNVGSMLTLVGMDDTDTVTIADDSGLLLNGPCTLTAGSVLTLVWGGIKWYEVSRSL